MKEFIPLDNCIVYKSDIVAFIDEKLSKLINTSKSGFKEYLETNHLSFGLSLQMTDISNCKKYYLQAFKALEISQKQNFSIFSFEDCVEYIISEFISDEYDVIDFCHPVAVFLMNYDKDNNTDLLQTLKNYLFFTTNPNEAAKVLCIHRNTLFYRINKIKDLTGNLLDNGAELSKLYFSIRLLELNGILPAK